MTGGLSTWTVVAWWATLGAGLVVALVVWALLEALRRAVDDVRVGVERVLGAGGALAQNTQAAHLLGTTNARARDVLAELERHRENQEGRQG